MSNDLRKNLSERPSALVGYPQPIDSSRAAVIIAQRSRVDLQNVVIVTSDTLNAKSVLEKSDFVKNDTEVHDYSQGEKFLEMKDSLFVFDSIAKTDSILVSDRVVGMRILPQLIINGNIVIVLMTHGVSDPDIMNFTKFIPNAFFLWSTFLEGNSRLDYVLHQSEMTSTQEIAYTNARREELNKYPDDNTYKFSQRICNILLSDKINNLIDTKDEPLVEDSMKLFKVKHVKKGKRRHSVGIVEPSSPPNQEAFKTDEFLENSPKMKDLLSQLTLYSNMRHVIFSRYSKHHGTKMIHEVLDALGFNVFFIPYGSTEKDYERIVNEFNKGLKPAILVTSTYFNNNFDKYNVSHFHMFDGGYTMLNAFLEDVFRFRLYKGIPSNLTIHSYVCSRRITYDETIKSPSPDEIFYKNFDARMSFTGDLWKKIKKTAAPVVVGPSGYLSLMTTTKR
jgi:hypothetical protein